jgi:hypothetical protein
MTQEQLRMQMLAGIITEGQYKVKLNEEGMTLPIPNFLKMGEPEFKVNFVKFSNNSKNGDRSQVRNDGSFPVSVETDAEGKGPGNKFVINAFVDKSGTNLDYIWLPGHDNSDVLVKYVKDWGALRKYITSELAKTPTAAPTAESIEQVVNEALRVYRKK